MRACPLICIQVLFLLGHLFLCSRTASNLLKAATPCAAAIGNVLSEAVYSPPNDASSTSSLSISSKKPRLEYMHIPKTGGSMLEALGGKNGYSWGACHFVDSAPEDWLDKSPWKHCPPLVKNHTYPHKGGYSYWHVPLYVLPRIITDRDAYDNSVTDGSGDKMFFTVIRNPYDRMISIYYYFNGPQAYKNDAKHMNDYILTEVRDKASEHAPNCYTRPPKKPICFGTFKCGTQYDFVYDKDTGKQVIPFLLHFETLQQDFDKLANMHNLDFHVPNKQSKQRGVKSLTADDLSAEVIAFINDKFRNDFELGRRYEMRQPASAKLTTSNKKKRAAIGNMPLTLEQYKKARKQQHKKKTVETKRQEQVEMAKRKRNLAGATGRNGKHVQTGARPIVYPIGYGKQMMKRT